MKNCRNKLLTLEDVENIFRNANIYKKPNNLSIYQTAFTHKSFSKDANVQSYESLEFFGDSIVNASTIHYLYHRYGEYFDEGKLTKLKTKIVSSAYLSKFARYLNFAPHILLSEYIENIHGRDIDRLLEDTFESFVASISEDIDYQTAKKFVVFCIDHLIDFADLIYFNQNFKDIILNHFQINGWNHPKYEINTELGPQYKKSFVVSLFKFYKNKNKKQIKQYVCEGVGKTKKEAEMNASYHAVIMLNVNHRKKIN